MDGCLCTVLVSLAGGRVWTVAVWWAATMSAVAVLAAVVLYLRRRLGVGKKAERTRGQTFSIEQLERMRSDGSLSDSEFKVLRNRALGFGGPSGGVDNASSSRGGDHDD